MRTLRRNSTAGSILLQAIDAGVLQRILVCDRDIGHFEVDHGAHLFLLTAREDRAERWTAILDEPFISALAEARQQPPRHDPPSLFTGPYLWIVCGDECCELRPCEWGEVIDLEDPSATTIHLQRPPNCSFRVWSEVGSVSRTIPLQRFPSLAA